MSRPFPEIPVGDYTYQWYTLIKDPEIIDMVVGCPINIKENIDYNHPMKELKISLGEKLAANTQIKELLQKMP